MIEFCKDCKRPMGFIREYHQEGFNFFEYQCKNEGCNSQPKRIFCVCDQCEREDSYWEDECETIRGGDG